MDCKWEFYVSPLQLDKIGGFIDSQGLTFTDQQDSPLYFIPFELSFCGNNGNIHFVYALNVPNDSNSFLVEKPVKAESLTNVGFKFNNNETYTNAERVEKFVKHIQLIVAEFVTPDKPYIAVRNPKLAHFLKVFKIKFVDFNSPFFNVPSLKQLDKEFMASDTCEIHRHCPDRVFVCSKRKAAHYQSWINKCGKNKQNE